MLRVAFVGVGYFPSKTNGEKNFYLQLIPLLREKVGEVIVLSINDQDQEMFLQPTSCGDVPIYNFKRPLHWGSSARFHEMINGVHCYHHRHGVVQEMLEKFLTVFVHASKIAQILSKHKIDIIYFMDNFGIGMRYAKVWLAKKTVFAAANYDPRGMCYNQLQALFLSKLDMVIAYSQAYRDILSSIGIEKNHISVIHWGVDPAEHTPLSEDDKRLTRQQHGVKDGKTLILWTGYIQQIQEKDFFTTVSVAKNIIKRRPDIQFIFCFKPETYRPIYKDDEDTAIQVVSGAPNFRKLLGSADILLSPTYKLPSTVSPPLTWIEAMAMGVPVITTRVKGAEEIITHGKTGFISDNYETLADDIESIVDAGITNEMRGAARQKIYNDYNIHKISENCIAVLSCL